MMQTKLRTIFLRIRLHVPVAALLVLTACLAAVAQRPTASGSHKNSPPPVEDPLDHFNASVEELVKKVWPSVVQIQVTSYGPREEIDRGNTSITVGRQRSVGSGFVIDADGYIMTNAHVVSGAQRIQVVLPPGNADGSLSTALSGKKLTVPDRLVGFSTGIDLALV